MTSPSRYFHRAMSPPTSPPPSDLNASPNQSDLFIADVSHALLSAHSSSPLLDVTLHCSDSVSLRANKTLLVLRSTFFKTLFLSPFKESSSCTANLPISSSTLREVLHYLYAAESPLTSHILSQAHPQNPSSQPHPSPPPPTTTTISSSPSSSPASSRSSPVQNLAAVIALAVAADYLNLSHLQALTAEALTTLFHTTPSIACAALDAAVVHRDSAFRHCDPLSLWADVLRRPELLLGLRDVRDHHAHPNQPHPPPPFRPHLLDLSPSALDFLLRSAPPTDPDVAELVFQALHTWATHDHNPSHTSVPSSHQPVRTSHAQFRHPSSTSHEGIPHTTNPHIVIPAINDNTLRDHPSTHRHHNHNPSDHPDNPRNNPPRSPPVSPALAAAAAEIARDAHAISAAPTPATPGTSATSDASGAPGTSDASGPSNTPELSTEAEIATSERWQHAQRLAGYLDISCFEARFIVDFVEPSNLLSRAALLDAYRSHVIRSAASLSSLDTHDVFNASIVARRHAMRAREELRRKKADFDAAARQAKIATRHADEARASMAAVRASERRARRKEEEASARWRRLEHKYGRKRMLCRHTPESEEDEW